MTPLLAALLACAGKTNVPVEAPEPPAPVAPAPASGGSTSSAIRAATGAPYGVKATSLAMSLHRSLREDGNSASSGTSLGLALGMLAAGAKGDTLTELEALLGPVDEAFHIEQERAIAAMSDTHGVELAVANGLWVQEGFTVEEPFTALLTRSYAASPSALPFESDPSAAAGVINDWASEHTDGRIPKLFEADAVRGQKLVLANAVAFKGIWATPFLETSTRDRTFSVDGAPVEVSTMSGKRRVSLHTGQGWTAIAIPYEGEMSSMLIVLPDPGVTLESVEDGLDAAALAAVVAARPTDTRILLPKWSAHFDHDLKAPLLGLGVKTAFSDDADLSGIAPDLSVSSAIQKVFVEVNEKGTEAAAVTGITIGITSAGPPPVPFTVDRPFFWAIWHHELAAPVFVGRVTDPR